MKRHTLNIFGTIDQAQIKELWKIKLLVYALRDANWIKKMVFAPLLILILDIGISQLNKNIILVSTLMSLAYVALSFTVFIKLHSVQARVRSVLNPYPTIAFLHSMFDLATLFMLVASCLLLGILMLSDLFVGNRSSQILLVFLIFMILASLGLSARLINNKSLSRLKDNKSNALMIALLSVLAIVPSSFIFFSALLLQAGRIEIVKASIGFISYTGSLLLLPYIMAGTVEMLILLKNWPDVKRTGSDFLL